MGGTPSLDLLGMFVAVAESASFSAAAKKLGVPKSSVSRGIARLEAELDTQLLHRTTHAVGLTTSGTALFERVAPLVASLRQAVGSLPEEKETPSGVLRVTLGPELGTAWAAEMIARFTFRHPRVRVEVRITNDFVDLIEERLDVALRLASRPLKDSTLVARKLAEMEIHFYASPEYVARRGQPRSLEDLAGHDLVSLPGLRKHLEVPVPEERERIVANEFSFVREAVRAGAGIGALPTFLTLAELEAGELVRVLPRWAERRGTLYFVHPSAQHVPAKVRAFRDFLVEQLAFRPLGAR